MRRGFCPLAAGTAIDDHRSNKSQERMTMRSTSRQWWKRAAVSGMLLAGLLFNVSAFAAGKPDAWVTTKVKLALLTTEGVSSTDVNVDTVDGRVTLHGTVGSEEEKTRAEKAARSVEGVKELRNMLAVV